MTDKNDILLASLNHRFNSLMVCSSLANELAGNANLGEVPYEESEQGFARRELLNVEKQAIEDRLHQQLSEESYIDSVNNEFHQLLLERFDDEISDTANLYKEVLGLNEALPELLDMLAVKSCSIGRLEPIAARIPWLYDELLKVVNAPQHRRKDSRGKVIVVETLRTALSFINIDNLKMLIPVLAFRRTIPQVTDPYPQIKVHALQYAIASGLVARQLASSAGVRENDAFVFGVLHSLGRNTITRLYFRLFEKMLREQLEVAQRKKERARHTALGKIQPSSKFIIALWHDLGNLISANIIQHMQLKRVFIADAAQLLVNASTLDISPLSRLIQQSADYAQFRLMSANKLLTNEEAKLLLLNTQLPVCEIEKLNKLDIRNLPLKMKPELTE